MHLHTGFIYNVVSYENRTRPALLRTFNLSPLRLRSFAVHNVIGNHKTTRIDNVQRICHYTDIFRLSKEILYALQLFLFCFVLYKHFVLSTIWAWKAKAKNNSQTAHHGTLMCQERVARVWGETHSLKNSGVL